MRDPSPGRARWLIVVVVAACTTGVVAAAPAIFAASHEPKDTEPALTDIRVEDRLSESDFDAMQRALSEHIPAGRELTYFRQTVDDNGMPSAESLEDPSSGYVAAVDNNGQEWKLFAAGPSATGDVGRCGSGATAMAAHCEETVTAKGLERVQVFLSTPLPSAGPHKFVSIQADDVTKEMLPTLRVERVVRLFLNQGGMVSARQTIFGVRNQDFDAALEPTSTLASVVRDQSLHDSLATPN